MAGSLFNIEVLMGVSKNLREQNDDWRADVYREGRERAVRVSELLALFEREYAALDQERQRLAQYLPRQEPMPKVVTQGPKVAG
jgi:hypothetical protein